MFHDVTDSLFSLARGSLAFYEDRDRSGYTLEQREGYQRMQKELISHKYDILIVKDFSHRNSQRLVELEDLWDAGVHIISIGDGIDFPNDDCTRAQIVIFLYWAQV